MPAQVTRRPAPAPAPAAANGAAPPARYSSRNSKAGAKPPAAEHEILFQKYFKSVNPQRTYASQVKRANNGNHYLIRTEGRRDDATGEVRKTRLFIYSEDFVEFFRMLQETSHFLRDNPVPEEVKKKRRQFWERKQQETRDAQPAPERGAAPRTGSTKHLNHEATTTRSG